MHCPTPGAFASDLLHAPWNRYGNATTGLCSGGCEVPPARIHRQWLRSVVAHALWSQYVSSVYGSSSNLTHGDSSAPFPLRFLWASVPLRSSIRVSWVCQWVARNCTSKLDTGSVWAPVAEAVLRPKFISVRSTEASSGGTNLSIRAANQVLAKRLRPDADALWFPGMFVQLESSLDLPSFVPDDHFVQVFRMARVENKHGQKDQSTRGQVWYWLASGSGIWLFLGKSMRVRKAGTFTPGCLTASAQGYDSIQLASPVSGGYAGLVEIVDCRGTRHDPASATEVWEAACPPPLASKLHVGLPWTWPGYPSSHSIRLPKAFLKNKTLCSCSCESRLEYLNCARREDLGETAAPAGT